MSDQPTRPIFNGRYRVVRALASGGMAEVFLGEDLVLDRTVALKVLSAQLSEDAGFVERFRREAQAAAGLSHPNIVGVYDWGEADGSYFIVMEYVEGQTLAQLIRTEGPLTTERTAAIGADIAAALAVAHRHGVVHRDVKPGNVLIGSIGQVKVADFGIARIARWGDDAQLTQTGLVLGTAAYLSPEQAQGRIADARSDVYALGVVLYEMAAGRTPFRGDNPVSVAYQHAHEIPEPPSLVNPAVSVWLEAVILKALAKSPDARYSGAEDLGSDLSRGALSTVGEALTAPVAVAPTAVLAAPTEQVPASVTSRRSTRSAGRVAVAILAAALIGAAVYFGAFGPSDAHAEHGASTTVKTTSTSTGPTTTKPPANSTTSTTSTSTTSTASTTSQPTSFPGYQIVAGSGASALYCPAGAALGSTGPTGTAGPTGPAGNGPPGTPSEQSGQGGQGGAAGCGSNGGPGGQGGSGSGHGHGQGHGGSPKTTGGAGGFGGDGGCPPATLVEMQDRHYPCNGTGSNGGGGGNGGNSAPGERGGAGGRGGRGGDADNAKGGNGGNGGNATPAGPGGPGGPGQRGGGPNGTTPGVNGQNGANGTNG